MLSYEVIHLLIHQPFAYLKLIACLFLIVPKYTRKKTFIIALSIFSFFQVIYSYILFTYGFNTLKLVIFLFANVPAILSIYIVSDFRDSRALFSYTFVDIVGSCISYLSYMILISIFKQMNLFYIFCRLFSVTFFFVLFIKFYIPKIKPLFFCNEVNWRVVSGITLISDFYLFYIVFYKGAMPYRNDELIPIAFNFIMIGTITMGLIWVIRQSNLIFEKNKEIEIMNHQILQSEKINKNIFDMYEKIRFLRHDINKHYVVINSLVNEKKYTELQKYMDEITNLITPNKFKIFSKNMMINAIMNFYWEKMKIKNIELISKIDVRNLKEEDVLLVCLILGNTLENAVEASVLNKPINLICLRNDKQMHITIVNYYEGKILMDVNNNFLSIKENNNNHGLGIKIVKKLIEQRKGWCDFDFDQEKFTFKAIYNLL